MRSLIVVAALAFAGAAHADETTEHAEAALKATALAPSMSDVKVSMEAGIESAAGQGKPISARYQLEGAKIALSVFVMKGDAFTEIVTDPQNGAQLKTTPITGGDLAEAKKQAAAMAKAKVSLRDAVAGAEKANPGYKVVAIKPEIEKGKVEADVSLLKGASAKVIDWKL